jgi:hypothetical protein
LSRAITSAGVPFCAQTPFQKLASYRVGWPPETCRTRTAKGTHTEPLRHGPRRPALAAELAAAKCLHLASGAPARVFRDFRYRTLDSWSRRRRVAGIGTAPSCTPQDSQSANLKPQRSDPIQFALCSAKKPPSQASCGAIK